MALGRDESKRILCRYEGRQQECPKNCDKCAIMLKDSGDKALKNSCFSEAIQYYKRALFAEPKYADAWYCLATAYSANKELQNAVNAYDKALSIDPTYGEAMFGKAVALRDLGKREEAIALSEKILEMYNDKRVSEFSDDLIFSDFQSKATDKQELYSFSAATEIMTERAFEIAEDKGWLDSDGVVRTEKEIDQKKDFAKQIYTFCSKNYSSLGYEKAWSESITSAFYGAVCVTLNYYKDRSWVDKTSAFDYLQDHIDLERLDGNAEKMLGIYNDDKKSDELWDAISSFASYCIKTVNNVQPMPDMENAVLDATESAFILGMMVAMRFHRNKQSTSEKASNKLTTSINNSDNTQKENNVSIRLSTPSLPPFSTKKLSDYETLEQIELATGDNASDTLAISWSLLAETTEYFVCSCSQKTQYGSHLIRQSKNNPSEIVYLGYDFGSTCLFNGKLFYISPGYRDSTDLYSIDVPTGKKQYYKWFSTKAHITGDVGIEQDIIKSLHVENDKLIIGVSRSRSSIHQIGDEEDPFDVTMDYILCVGLDNGKYVLTRFYTDIDTSQLEELPSMSGRNWHVASAKGLYFLIDNGKRVAKSPKGFVLQTSYLDLANQMASDLERYGDNPPEITSLFLQMNMRDNVIQCTHKEMESYISTFFEKTDDWTYQFRPESKELGKLFGNKNDRTRTIESWLSKPSLMQLNAIFLLGKKYTSLNLPFLFAIIVEKLPSDARAQAFSRLSYYIKSNQGPSIAQSDFEVFSSYYEIHLVSIGATISDEADDIDLDTVFSSEVEGILAPQEKRNEGNNPNIPQHTKPLYCSACGAKLPGDTKFCHRCGKAI